MPLIRKADRSDLGAITDIYNEAVERTVATFDLEPKDEGWMGEWLDSHGPSNPVLVAELDGRAVGWAALSIYNQKAAYARTAELSLYVLEEHQGRGVGRSLMEAILETGRGAGLHSIISKITDGNDVSVYLHESLGFRDVGVMREVGEKFGRLLDVRIMQLTYH